MLLLFGGRGKISDLMGDVAKGIKAFKKGMAEDDKTAERQDRAGQDHRPSGRRRRRREPSADAESVRS